MVGTQLCLGVKLMYLTGLGGGGFMLIRAPNGIYSVVDFRETAPAACSEDMFNDNITASLSSGLASGIPGELRGLEYLHRVHGTLPWKDLVGPAIGIARDGFVVDEELLEHMSSLSSDFLVNDPVWAIDFAPNGTRVKLGERITRKRYADLLETVATEGPDAFYFGTKANHAISTLQQAGGLMTMDDLAGYAVTVREPVQADYRGFRVTSSGSPSSGAVVLNVLKVVEGYPDFGLPESLDLSTHRLDEAIRFGYGLRTTLGDPSFNDTVQIYESDMFQDSTIERIRGKISDIHTLPVSDYNPDNIEILDTPGTSEVVTADSEGLVISLTSTININFGSGVMVPETGLIMNNEMNDFSIPGTTDAFGYGESPANLITPGKRPLSSISPVIVDFANNGSFYFATGASGGSHIITATLQSLWHVLDRNKTVFDALQAPRFHDQLVPNQILFDYGYNNDTTAYIARLGHNVSWMGHSSGVNALKRHVNQSYEAVGEPEFPGSGGLVF
ncbi:MAG: hypothetical protein M1820_006927 [Bogoriella megaspora]|nr:MAG: hypothetical protein M1820_006927 [Bogoriella megaspora]